MTQTDINKRKLTEASSLEKVNLDGMETDNLSEALYKLFQTHNTNASRISTITGISRSYISELQGLKRNHTKPGRKKIIAICLAAGASLEETNYVLKTAKMLELYSRDEAEAIMIWGLLHKKNFEEIKALMADYGFDGYLGGE